MRSAFLELMRAIKDTDIGLFAVSVDVIGNNLERPAPRPARSFDVVGGTDMGRSLGETSDGSSGSIPDRKEAKFDSLPASPSDDDFSEFAR